MFPHCFVDKTELQMHYLHILLTLFALHLPHAAQALLTQPPATDSDLQIVDNRLALNDFSNLHVVLLGDSETAIGGDQCNQPLGWNKWFAEALQPASCRSYARSGATWTNTIRTKLNREENIGILGDDNVIYNQVERLKAAVKTGEQVTPNLIIIAAGTNDAWFQKRRPGVFDKSAAQAFSIQDKFITDRKVNTITSLTESIRYNCELLMQAFPDAQIILLTPMQAAAVPTTEILRTADTIAECAKWLSVGLVRMDGGSSLYRPREKVKNKFTYDGTHTNEAGARRNGRYVARQVAAMLYF